MPTPLDFMSRVLAWPGDNAPGYGNIHWTKDGKWRGRPFKTAEAAVEMAQYLATRPAIAKDIYYCLTIQSATGKVFKGKATALRAAQNAMSSKALWLDIDIKDPPKGYASLGDAIDALTVFCSNTQLPPPSALISSGGGLHVYWIFDTPMTIPEWKPYALGLKELAQRNGLLADLGVTADPARVLRVPGTFNRKLENNPRPVKIIAWGPDYDRAKFAHLEALGKTQMPAVTAAVSAPAEGVFDLTGFEGGPAAPFSMLNPMADVLGEGCKKNSDLPLDPTNMINECPHFNEVFRTGGAHQPQGVWMLDVLAATWLFNGEAFAEAFSRGYNNFQKSELDAMWARKMQDKADGKGWPSCFAFESQGCTACKTCPLKGTIKSPLNLADRIQVEPRPVVPAAVRKVQDDLLLPYGYELNDDGVVSKTQEDKVDEDSGEAKPRPPIPLFHARFAGTPWCTDTTTGGGELHFNYVDPHHDTEVNVPYSVLGSDQALFTCLASQSVMIKSPKLVGEFMRSWVAQIDRAQKRRLAVPFGWVYEGKDRVGFAYGGTTFRPNGRDDRSAPADRAFASNYTPKGEIGPIIEMMNINRSRNNPALDVLTLASWASPLLFVTGEGFAGFWAWGGGSGAGKSTAIMTGMALWSSPGKTKTNGFRTTPAGFERKMGQLMNLPLIADEMTDNGLIDKFIPLLQMASELQSGQLARRDGSMRPMPTWANIVICGSNKSLHDRQVQLNGGTNAQIVRVLQFNVKPTPSIHTQHDVSLVRASLDHNYGGLGLQYAKFLATNIDWLTKRGAEIMKEVSARVNNTHDERFWMAGIVSVILAAECANLVIGSQMFDRDSVKEFLIQTLLENRAWVADNVQQDGTQLQAEEVLARFLEDHTNNQLATDKMNLTGGRPKGLIHPYVVPASNTGKGNVVHIHWGIEPRLLRVHLPEFRAYVQRVHKDKATPSEVINGLIKTMNAKQVRNVDMLAGTKLTIAQAPTTVLQIPVPPGSFLSPLLEKFIPEDCATLPSAQFAQQDAAKADLGGLFTAAVTQAQQDLAVVRAATEDEVSGS